MSYTKLGNWYNESSTGGIPSGATPLSADTMEYLETGIANAHTGLATLASNSVDVEMGYYIGDGKTGDDSPTVISFKNGRPMFLVILRDLRNNSTHGRAYENRFFAIRGQDQVCTVGGASGANSAAVNLVWEDVKQDGGYKVSLYTGNGADASWQMNINGERYCYFAIIKREV